MRFYIYLLATTCVLPLSACSDAPAGASGPRASGDAGASGPPRESGDPTRAGQTPPDTYPARPCTGPRQSGQAVLCVDAAAAAGGEGTAARPYTTMRAAIAASKAGDAVQVADGTYAENVQVDRALELLGGFPARGDFGRRDGPGHRTVIRGRGGDAAVYLARAGTALVTGFRITGGTGHELGGSSWAGGGVYADAGEVTIAFNLIEENDMRHGETMARGGGVNVDGADARILYNVIRKNQALRGAGIAASGDLPIVIRGNVVADNDASGDHGGGVFVSGKDVSIVENLVSGNSIGRALGFGWGGGAYAHSKGTHVRFSGNVWTENFAPLLGAGVFVDNEATGDLDHELVVKNACALRGGAVYVDGSDNSGTTGAAVTIASCTIADHDCPLQDEQAGGLYVEGDSRATVKDTVFWHNGARDTFAARSVITASYTLSKDALPGAGNVTGDPRFVDAAASDYRLAAGSPAIDAADPAGDYSKEPVPNGGRVDMGVYGGTAKATPSRR